MGAFIKSFKFSSDQFNSYKIKQRNTLPISQKKLWSHSQATLKPRDLKSSDFMFSQTPSCMIASLSLFQTKGVSQLAKSSSWSHLTIRRAALQLSISVLSNKCLNLYCNNPSKLFKQTWFILPNPPTGRQSEHTQTHAHWKETIQVHNLPQSLQPVYRSQKAYTVSYTAHIPLSIRYSCEKMVQINCTKTEIIYRIDTLYIVNTAYNCVEV